MIIKCEINSIINLNNKKNKLNLKIANFNKKKNKFYKNKNIKKIKLLILSQKNIGLEEKP